MRWAVAFGGTLVLALSSAAQAQGQEGAIPVARPVLVPPAPVAPPRLIGKARVPVPKNSPANWVTSDDYPAEALRNRVTGIAAFRLVIGTDGKVTGCTITESSGSQQLDDATCSLVSSRALFQPALDSKGKPSSGLYYNRVRWAIPTEQEPFVPIAVQADSQVVTFTVEVDGTATNCTYLHDGAPAVDPKIKMPCGLGVVFAPVTNAQGKPVRKTVKIESSTTLSDPAP